VITPQGDDIGGDMDDVDIPSERVPEGLKSCEQILKRAKELKKAEPVVSYWCEWRMSGRWFPRSLLPAQTALRSIAGCFSAAEKVLQVHSRTKEQTMFLMSLLDALEKVSPTELLALAS
jgi:vacuolar protein sorting-associated protein VTA1